MEITEKVAYLKGLMEGMKIDTETNEGKILSAMVDILEDIGLELEDLWNAQGELEDGLDAVSYTHLDVYKRQVSKRLPGFPIVLHGSSSVPQEFVKMVNENGGKMPDAVGIPEEQLRLAAKSAVCKINIDSDLRLAMTGTIRKFFAEHPDKFDPREYLKPAREAIKQMVMHKMIDVLGCNGKA